MMDAPNNPYRPPSARVGDVMTPRPRAASIAIWLLWMSIAIEVLAKVLDVHDKLQREATVVVASGITMALVGVVCGLIVMTGRRRNWARIGYAVLFALGMGYFVTHWQEVVDGPFRDLLSIVMQSGLQIVAMMLLFLPSSNAWFRPARDAA
jgi:hypothetical protein